MAVSQGLAPDYRAELAKHLVRQDTLRRLKSVDFSKLPSRQTSPGNTKDGLDRSPSDEPLIEVKKLKVGIIGAGIAGLYAAWILQFLGIDWQILEANPERLGGRIYTHHFDGATCGNNYYDVGAMRFQNKADHSRFYKVIDATNTEIAPYLMSATKGNTPTRYDDKTVFPTKKCSEPGCLYSIPTHEAAEYENNLTASSSHDFDAFQKAICKEVLDLLKQAVDHANSQDAKLAWHTLIKYDQISFRDYLRHKRFVNFESAQWLETLNTATGWFEQSVLSIILGSFADSSSGGPPQSTIPELEHSACDGQIKDASWHYIVNGSSTLINNILRKIECISTQRSETANGSRNVRKRILKGRRVTKVGLDTNKIARPLTVTYTNTCSKTQDSTRAMHKTFDAVLNTTTLAALQKTNLTGLNLPRETKLAIRSITYASATKVAMRFKTQWWSKPIHTRNGLGRKFHFDVRGGTATTDLPLRTCIYPSYGGTDDPAILLCSYTWGADSDRIASMFSNGEQPGRDDHIVQVMLDNLASLHTQNTEDYQDLLHFITNDFDICHAHDWSRDEYVGGGFAHFSPGQLSHFYPAIVRPLADSRFYIVGEAASAHPGWVVGSLDSAARGVYMMLGRFNLRKEQEMMIREFGEITEIDYETEHVQIALGMLGNGADA